MGNGANVVSENFVIAEPAPSTEPDIITKKLTHGCNLFIQNPAARNAFVDFLKSGEWIDSLCADKGARSTPLQELFMDFSSSAPKKEPEPEPESTEPQTNYYDYVLPAGKSYDFINSRFAEPEEPVIPERTLESVIETCFTISQMKTILLASVFPIFIESDIYVQLIKETTEEVQSSSNKNAIAQAEAGRDERLDELFQPRPRRLRDIVSQALSTVDESEVVLMLRSGDWLQNLIATVEDLPLCVSLATARPERRGFPLVYVNKAFESTTGYDRKDIIGRNCAFLQSEHSEQDQIAKLQDALRTAQPVKVALTNRRKDGVDFFNLLAMKPVFDNEGVYSYVIGVQYDITNRAATQKEIMLVNDLLSILPNILH